MHFPMSVMNHSEVNSYLVANSVAPPQDLAHIRESVDSLCRDGANTPISLNIQNCSKLPNAAVISLFRHIIWSWSSSVPDNSLKVGKITRYSDTQKTAKTPISPSSSSSSSSSVDRPTTKLVQVLTFISAQNNCFLVCARS